MDSQLSRLQNWDTSWESLPCHAESNYCLYSLETCLWEKKHSICIYLSRSHLSPCKFEDILVSQQTSWFLNGVNASKSLVDWFTNMQNPISLAIKSVKSKNILLHQSRQRAFSFLDFVYLPPCHLRFLHPTQSECRPAKVSFLRSNIEEMIAASPEFKVRKILVLS